MTFHLQKKVTPDYTLSITGLCERYFRLQGTPGLLKLSDIHSQGGNFDAGARLALNCQANTQYKSGAPYMLDLMDQHKLH